MIFETTSGIPLNGELLYNYLHSLINMFFKILPIKENGGDTLVSYMRSLQAELLGCGGLISALHDDRQYVSLLSILQYLIDNPDCPVTDVRREVFGAISICNKLIDKYCASVSEE